MNPENSSYFGNASQTLSNGLTPFAQSFSYGGNTLPASAVQASSWQQAARENGAGPNASNLSAPWSFDQFALGLNPFINPGTGQRYASKTGFDPKALIMLLALVIGGLWLIKKL